jgi:nitrogen regulatory protein P-II 1
MKLIVAIIRPDKLNDVLESLYRADVKGLTVSRVLGHGGETDAVETYRGTTVKMELHEKVRLEIGVSNPFIEVTVRAILEAACTGEVGDGKIFVVPVESVYRIRTKEKDEAAVTPALNERGLETARGAQRHRRCALRA